MNLEETKYIKKSYHCGLKFPGLRMYFDCKCCTTFFFDSTFVLRLSDILKDFNWEAQLLIVFRNVPEVYR